MGSQVSQGRQTLRLPDVEVSNNKHTAKKLVYLISQETFSVEQLSLSNCKVEAGDF